ncbi:DUF4269 domain-containing protein [uncultured Aquimarina sp.]|uniref:DUF4269 domain-containing protein n=1 Tax=uncultured Aquimarina sp. TaxID=575652 RepID=UPI002611D2E7|nr:DUF4269 domain-containing protein [uncultured Aquimarina sp.]
MIKDFTNIEYLKTGNKRQQQAYIQLSELEIFDKLNTYNPILTGTIPIEIDTPKSDLDIICHCPNHQEFQTTLTKLYADQNDFEIRTGFWNGLTSVIAKFQSERYVIEIFGQNQPTQKQYAYRHMIKEYKILQAKGIRFKEDILKLKKQGLKTEPAFAKLLGLTGDPYEELLKFKIQ